MTEFVARMQGSPQQMQFVIRQIIKVDMEIKSRSCGNWCANAFLIFEFVGFCFPIMLITVILTCVLAFFMGQILIVNYLTQ